MKKGCESEPSLFSCSCLVPLLGGLRGTAIELSPAAVPHWQALNLNLNRNLARLRFLEIKSKITIKIGKKPFRLNSMAVHPVPPPEPEEHPTSNTQRRTSNGIANPRLPSKKKMGCEFLVGLRACSV